MHPRPRSRVRVYQQVLLLVLRTIWVSVVCLGFGISLVHAQHQQPPDQAPATTIAPTATGSDQTGTLSNNPAIGPSATAGIVTVTSDLPDTIPAGQELALLASGMGVAVGTGLLFGGNSTARFGPTATSSPTPPTATPVATATPQSTSPTQSAPTSVTPQTDEQILEQLESIRDPHERYLLIQQLRPDWITDQAAPTATQSTTAQILMEEPTTQLIVGDRATYNFDPGSAPHGESPRIRSFVIADPASVGQLTRRGWRSGSLPVIRGPRGQWRNFRWQYPGTHTVVYEVQYAGQPPQYHTLTQTVVTAEDQSAQQLEAAPEPIPADQYVASLQMAIADLQQRPTPNTELMSQLEAALAEAQTLLTGTVEPIKATLIVEETGQVMLPNIYLKTLPDGSYQIIDVTNPHPEAIGAYEGDTVEEAWQEYLANNHLPAGQLAAIPPAVAGAQSTVWHAHTHEHRSWRRRASDWLWAEREWAWYGNLLESWRQSGWLGQGAAGVVGFVVDLLSGIDSEGNFQWGWFGFSWVMNILSVVGVGLLGKLGNLAKALKLGRIATWFRNLRVVRWLGGTRFARWLANSALVRWFRDPERLNALLQFKWGTWWDEFARAFTSLKPRLLQWLGRLRNTPILGPLITRLEPWFGRLGAWFARLRGGTGGFVAGLRTMLQRLAQQPFVQRISALLANWASRLSRLPVIGPTLQFLKNTWQGLVKFLKNPAKILKTIGDMLWAGVNSGVGGVIGAVIKWFVKDIIQPVSGSGLEKAVQIMKRLFMLAGAGSVFQRIAEWLGWFTPPPPPTGQVPPAQPTPNPAPNAPSPAPSTPSPAPNTPSPAPNAPSPTPNAPGAPAPGASIPNSSSPSTSGPTVVPPPTVRPVARPVNPNLDWPLVHYSDSGENVVTLQAMLRQQGYDITYNGLFDDKTHAAVIQFQRDRGLVEDGIVGRNTWSALISTVRLGDHSLVVEALQRQLVHRHGYQIAIDGRFGSVETQPTVIAFQESQGLEPDGIVGQNTWSALLSGTSTSRPSNGTSTPITGTGRVNYNGFTVSDPVVRRELQEIADFFGSTVVLTSGDRNHVPPGGSRTSLHLVGRAADFYVEGLSLTEAFNRIRASGLLNDGNFEFINHLGVCNGGPATIPAHLHLGHYSNNRNRHMIEECGSYRVVGP
ncbi:MAG: peptidoglycan-binding protein [Chloroflexota bacterium]